MRIGSPKFPVKDKDPKETKKEEVTEEGEAGTRLLFRLNKDE